ncbi:MAG: TraR/DksA family transcriptional regulator [Treponema sp.]|jgi:RNA polymerase-binding protein DksA|nr:TraR/DksA family transcriptional regulator [Treponema sp.]
MEQDFNLKMKDSLTEMKREIIATLAVNNDDFRKIVDDMESKDVVDIASDAIDSKMLETFGSKDMNRLKLIDSALMRIEQGKYGLCLKCSKKIPQERLEAIPYAFLCINCKSDDERRNR